VVLEGILMSLTGATPQPFLGPRAAHQERPRQYSRWRPILFGVVCLLLASGCHSAHRRSGALHVPAPGRPAQTSAEDKRVVVMHVHVCQDGSAVDSYGAPPTYRPPAPSEAPSYERPSVAAFPLLRSRQTCITPYRLDVTGVRTYRSECLGGVRGAWGSQCDVPYVVGRNGVRTFKRECL